ncbi:hypothetical protein MRX96_052459 [Rhipicephalus microplus]
MAKSPSSNVEISVIVAGENHSPNSCSGGTTTQESDVSRNNDGAPLRPKLQSKKDRKLQVKQPHISRESLESKRERKACQDPGHHHGRVRRLLDALLRQRAPHDSLHVVLVRRLRVQRLSVAWLRQLHAQPDNLHHLQPRLQERLQKTTMWPKTAVWH